MCWYCLYMKASIVNKSGFACNVTNTYYIYIFSGKDKTNCTRPKNRNYKHIWVQIKQTHFNCVNSVISQSVQIRMYIVCMYFTILVTEYSIWILLMYSYWTGCTGMSTSCRAPVMLYKPVSVANVLHDQLTTHFTPWEQSM